ncbi:lamin Dm0-like [Topomyia yanbarensis]|uniref:lamin Dm0-like n=1 Tax=Topomyia yanbarensis TaxID=2498891 RepID=UPI00273B01AE|nr:lamin Dm0-like [Topomyia yanbarensis]
MSQRSKKSATKATSTSGAQSVSSSASTVSSMTEISETALSPSRRSRLQEKNSLINLNDRLVCYIERVRFLEQENSRLSLELAASQDAANREIANLKSIYEGELTDARKLLDETARDKAKVEIDAKRYWEESDQLRMKLNKKTKELTEVEKEARISEARVIELTANYNSACSERKKLHDELRETEMEAAKLKKTFENMRKDLEHETLLRVDLENNVQSLREELTFKEQVHLQELSESKLRRQSDLSEIDGFLMEQYETKLQQTLQELRDQYDSQLRMNRDEISELYDARIHSLENRLSSERAQHEDERQKMEKEINHLRDEMSVHLKEYQDLMDIKISLDMEIAAYDKLLSSEETRLNITPNVTSTTATASAISTSSRLFRTPSLKRRRDVLDDSLDYSVTSSAKGDLELTECDPEGKFVKVHNKSKETYQLDGWQIRRKTESSEVIYKFPKSAKIEGNATATIMSASTGQKASSSCTLVMKGQSWATGDSMTTILLNPEGDEVAHAERVKMKSYSYSGHKDKYFLEEGGARLGMSISGGKSPKVSRSAGEKNEEQCRVM